MKSFIRTSAGVLACLALLIPAATASAGPQPAEVPTWRPGSIPVPQLNPEPPDSYACTPQGRSTVCLSDTSQLIAPTSIGAVCGDLVDPESTRRTKATRLYNANGDLVQRTQETFVAGTLLCNPATGAVVRYRQHEIDTDVLAVPGNLSTATRHSVESLVASGPGHRDVLVNRVRAVYGADGRVPSRTGRRDFDAYFAGDPAVVAKVRAAIGA